MLKLVQRDLFIYQGKNTYVICVAVALSITLLYVIGAGTGLSNGIFSIALYMFFITTQQTFGCDEATKFNRFLRATPVSANTIVMSRYVSCISSALMGIVTLFVVGVIANTASVFYPALQNDVGSRIDVILLCVISLVTICSFLFPVLFRFGFTKAKYPLMLLVVAAGSTYPLLISDAAASAFNSFLSMISVWMYVGYAVLAAALLCGSYALSVAVVKRKEF